MKVRWSQRAVTQLLEAVTYLEDQRPQAGANLNDALRNLIDIAKAHPLAFPRVPRVGHGEIRRALEKRYNYWLIYEIIDDPPELVVLAVWHTRRRPLGWRN